MEAQTNRPTVGMATTQPTGERPRAQPVPKRSTLRTRRIKITITLVAVALAVSAVVVYELSPHQTSAEILSGYVWIYAGENTAKPFTTPSSTNIHAVGSFTSKISSGPNAGSDGSIIVQIMNDTYYQEYVVVGSFPPSTFYNSGNVTSGSFDVKLPADTTCHVVFWDRSSTSRNVTTTVNLFYG